MVTLLKEKREGVLMKALERRSVQCGSLRPGERERERKAQGSYFSSREKGNGGPKKKKKKKKTLSAISRPFWKEKKGPRQGLRRPRKKGESPTTSLSLYNRP